MSESDPPDSQRMDPRRTMRAQKAFDVAQIYVASLQRVEVSGHAPNMRTPSGVSTEGGKQAVQHIVLEPKNPGLPTVTVGHVNVVAASAKLRSFECLEQMHALRFHGRPFALDPAEYARFFDLTRKFLENYGLVVDIETRPPEVVVPETRRVAPESASGGNTAVLWALVFLVFGVLGGSGYWFFFLRR